MSKKNNLTLVGLNNQDNDLFGGFGDDHLTGGNNAVSFTIIQNILVGDAQNMLAFEKGGGDTLIGGNSSTDDPNVFQADVVNILGDAAEGMLPNSTRGGKDTLIGGNISRWVRAPSKTICSATRVICLKSSRGGNDLLTGGDNDDRGFLVFNNLFGDARNMFEVVEGRERSSDRRRQRGLPARSSTPSSGTRARSVARRWVATTLSSAGTTPDRVRSPIR